MRTADPVKEEQTRQEILSAARKLFQKYGLDKTTMEDIAQAAGKGKSSLYYYYKSKEEVFLAVIEKDREEAQAAIAKAVGREKMASAKLRAFVLTRSHEVKSKINSYSVILAETRKHLNLFNTISKRANSWEREMLRNIFIEGVKSGEFKNIDVKDCDTIAVTAIATMHGQESNIILEGKLPGEEIRLEIMTDIFIRGLKA